MRTSSNDQCSKRKSDFEKDSKKRGDSCFSRDENRKLYIIGIGPGDIEQMSLKAYRQLQEVEVIAGYKTYINLINEIIKDKQTIFSTGMKKEKERALKAIEFVRQGKDVAVISSGDPGIYGMAGLVLELLEKKDIESKPEIIPGITAGNAAAASLGAPLMHDFVVISLSDLLTPWSVIEKRLHKAGEGDFVVVLYNPSSKKRKNQIIQARKIMLKYKKSATPVGIVRNAKRGQEEIKNSNLEDMLDNKIDMLTTVIIGNSKTKNYNDLMITPRGYEL